MVESRAGHALNVVCLASYFKGGDFIRECKQQGCRVTLVTREKLLHEDWPRECLDELISVRDDADTELFIHTVSELARPLKVDRVVALEEYDVITAALVREHLRLAGMGSTTARLFRDKLAMRVKAQEAGIRVPDFVHVLNYNELSEYMNRVPAPWMLKPRSDVSAMGIRKMHESEQVWRTIDVLDARENLRERSSYYLLERFIAGDVYHVDSLVEEGKVVFAGVSKYGRPPMDVAHGGGIFISHTVKHGSREQKELLKLNRKLIAALGLRRGVAHAEFIKSAEDGHFYFLEVAARVGGAHIAEGLEAASGINLWRGWARVELAGGESAADVQPTRREYGGIALSLARQEYPDTASYTDPEIFYRVRKRHHVGLVVRSAELDRVTELLDQYARRFIDEFSATVPPTERPE
jgi:biotin carboxylase